MSTIDIGTGEKVKESENSKNTAGDVEADLSEKVRDEETEARKNLMGSTTWWFASTACPLLAGTFGPMANGFSICALVFQWRVYIPPQGTEEHGVRLTDPSWLIAVNAVSLLFALMGNSTLLLNMAQRLRFSTAQPLTITGFLTAGVLLIADMAALTSSPTYFITEDDAVPNASHALTAAFYYAGFAAGLYIIIGLLMCITVYGANKEYYDKDFNLTSAQRTLMLQTMSFIAYLLLGALVFSSIEGWTYLDGVYWANVTLLTVGLGDLSPMTNVGRGLLFPFAVCGILIVGLVIGSIRSLVLERGREKMSARIIEKRRETAVHNVDTHRQTIKISWFSHVSFSSDPALSPAQRREEEFNVMRRVLHGAERERRYFSLGLSATFALLLWFLGALIFMYAEKNQGWTYFESLYFTFVVLLTIGYGDLHPDSNFGQAFFVLWSLLAVPSLTILISNMGETIIKWFSDLTVWVGSLTVLPGEGGVRATFKQLLKQMAQSGKESISRFTPPGILGDAPGQNADQIGRMNSAEHQKQIMDKLAQRLLEHIEEEELEAIRQADAVGDELQRDMHFYHYVLSRECRNIQKDLSASPPREYPWADWEYYLKLMGNEDNPEDFPGQRYPDMLVPEPMRAPDPIYPLESAASADQDQKKGSARQNSAQGKAAERPVSGEKLDTRDFASGSPYSGSSTTMHGVVDRETELRELKEGKSNGASKPEASHSGRHRFEDNKGAVPLCDWSWLSDKSPLMTNKTEAEWILERLSAALERELNRQRKGYQRKPPISMKDLERVNFGEEAEKEEDAKRTGHADAEKESKEKQELGKAARGRVTGDS